MGVMCVVLIIESGMMCVIVVKTAAHTTNSVTTGIIPNGVRRLVVPRR